MARFLGLLALVAGLPMATFCIAVLTGVQLDAEYRGGAAGLITSAPSLADALAGPTGRATKAL